MVDVPPPAIVKPTSAINPAAQAEVALVEAAINSVPEKIQQLSRQIQISGTIAQPPTNNVLSLQTANGDLVIVLPQLPQAQQDALNQQLNSLYQSQKTLTVVVQPGNPPSQAFLLLPTATAIQQTPTSSAIGIPVQPALTALIPNQAPQNIPSFSAVVLPPDLPLPVNALTQRVIQALAPAVQAAIQNSNPNLNQPIPSGISSVPQTSFVPPQTSTLYAPIGNPLQASVTPTIPVAENAVTLETAPQALILNQNQAAVIPSPNTNLALLKPGTELTLRINGVLPPANQNPIPELPNQVVATIVSNGPGGQPILKAGDATLYIRQPINQPVGTTLLLTIEPGKMNMPSVLAVPDEHVWSGLQQALAALTQINPQLAHQVMQNYVPQANASLPGSLLFLFNAFQLGNPRSWLGNSAMDALANAGKLALIEKLTQEIRQMGHAVHDNIVGEWKSYTLPVQQNNQLNLLYLYVHRDGNRQFSQDEPGKPSPQHTRFLIDMKLSRLGALQLDGFIQRKKMDMVIRSENRLPAELHQDLRAIYTKTLTAIDYAGGLNFQTGRQGWIVIQKPVSSMAITT